MDIHEQIIAAADLLREHGYAVVPADEADCMHRTIDYAQQRSMQAYDAHLPLLWAMQALTDAAGRAVAPSRPVWLRNARSFLHHYRWHEQVHVSGFPTERT